MKKISGLPLVLCGAIALCAGTALALRAHPGPTPTPGKNPVPNTHANVLTGAAVYRDQCAGCHGAEGVPLRNFPRLEKQPAVLVYPHLKRDSDAELFDVLTHGRTGGMPSFADDLNETERWQTVLFLRHLGKDAPAITAELPPAKQ